MKIFTYWRQKKSRKMDNNAAAAAASSGSSLIHPARQQQLQARDHDQLCGATSVDDDQHRPHLLHSFYGSHAIKSLQDMLCPIYSSDLLHYKKPIEKNSVADTDSSSKDYDMDLLIYQYTLQNAILSIGTLGGELLNKATDQIDNENILSTLGIPSVDNDNLLKVAKPEKYCAHLFTTQSTASNVGDEGSFKGPDGSCNTSSNDKVHLNEEITKRPISGFEKVRVEMQWPCNKHLEQESKYEYAQSIISNSTFNDAALQEEIKKKQNLDHQPCTYLAGGHYGNPIDYHIIEDEMGENQHLLTFMSEELDINKKIGNIGHGMQENMEENLFINNQLDVLENNTVKEFLKGLIMHEEVPQHVASSDDESSKCRSSQGMMGPSRNTKEMMTSSRNGQWIIVSSQRNAQLEGIMGSSTDAQGKMGSSGAQGILGASSNAEGIMVSSRIGQGIMLSSPISSSIALEGIVMGLSENTQGVMDFFPSAQGLMDSSLLSARGIMGSSKKTQGIKAYSSTSNQEIMCSSADRVKGIRGFEQARTTIVTTKPKDKKTKFDEELDNENMATHNSRFKLASTCNHHMDLKRLIIAATPNFLAKHLIKRLKLGHPLMQMDRAACNYQCKVYKLLRMLGMKQSSVRKRELQALIVDEGVQMVNMKEDNERECKSYSSLADQSSFTFQSNNRVIVSNENWINTDDEYVVLELEGRK